jgi:hypothetical protein
VAERAPSGHPPADQVTRPDQLPRAAWAALDLFAGERVFDCWKTARGYLVLTSLRCVLIWQRKEFLRARAWEASPEVFLYDVREPRVVLGRFVEIEPGSPDVGGALRVAVDDPPSVVEEIARSIPEARREWETRRNRILRDLEAQRHRREEIASALAAGRPIPIARVPCAYCGNLISTAARSCPFCGAPVAGS